MANRPVFTVSMNKWLCNTENTEFEYFSGFSDSQKRKCIHSLHQAHLRRHPEHNVLEISSKSENPLGVKLSAFNLMLRDADGRTYSVESAFQGGKVFEKGGPYLDLLDASSRAAKGDPRLKNSGRLIAFEYAGERFELEPKTYFYNWLYLNALHAHQDLVEELVQYDAFTDIVFNPQKSVNCQAEAAAIYVSLYRQGLIEEALESRENFLKLVYPNFGVKKSSGLSDMFEW